MDYSTLKNNNGCKACSKYPNIKCDACTLKIITTNCNPASKDLWYNHTLPDNVDPVLSNINNGCWMCGYEPQQTSNNRLCQRNFYSMEIPPYDYVKSLDIQSKLINRNVPLTRWGINPTK